ncbi:dTDP-4-dehydrorhamnose 3,5-epimerase [Pseudoflavonifractor sp. 524-17]|uniref:dTDP-4-dehydrorhamnose 3,5-epimerase n=1 Tax=Pseudoflavonifractor sp. 524-17 TaxID=2304577 RepID=UPI00137AA8AF|nr:dTDP-4-dehydrorhamnose 3,5-epimerase [Pseudoflavonifractor sp. 524-17]NCE65118.1 dTDP-4-dehydrorhamnose 3,5-epimerase [Pseudoflavonifractor sp. 524-17]
MKITELELPGVRILEPQYFEDFRGYYCETYSKRTMAQHGIETIFVQDNHSLSLKKGIIRGIHFQNNPKPQIKLVRCTRGRVMDFAVDLRKDSPTFKKWVSVELTEENHKQIWIPSGFGHAFITLQDNCEVQYKVDELYYPEYDRAIAWNDPEISIDWGTMDPIISQKDTKAPTLALSDVNFTMELNG